VLFPSYEFVFHFLPLVLGGFFGLGALGWSRLAAGWLAVASLYFYSRWNVQFVGLLLASIAFNYVLALLISRATEPWRKRALVFAIASDIALLAYFKYTNFFIDTINQAADARIAHANIVLPIGISFFTFTQLAFLVDVYRGLAKEYNLTHYVLFVTYFPHLIAGPVLHHKQMMPQFAKREIYRPQLENVATGAIFFAIGIAKKIVVADSLGVLANKVFDAAAAGTVPGIGAAWAGAVSYTLQIYFDFSGYSDMAIGLSLLFGVQLPLNFNSPYKAASIIDFWRRWHMTLSSFLRDYLYVPLGGNRRGTARRFVNLGITMLLGGLWHGASWNFVMWGGLHGAYLAVNHAWRALWPTAQEGTRSLLRVAAGVLTTFCGTVIAWVFFRAADFPAASRVLGGMFGLSVPTMSDGALGVGKTSVSYIAVALLIGWVAPNSQELAASYRALADASRGYAAFTGRLPVAAWGLFVSALLLAGAIWQFGTVYDSPFLYFQF
jgi:alginate O-acetyltransferase complex protein AlgI